MAAQAQNRVKRISKHIVHKCQQCADGGELPGTKQDAPVLSVSADHLNVYVPLSATANHWASQKLYKTTYRQPDPPRLWAQNTYIYIYI
jgi:hypothetical protein